MPTKKSNPDGQIWGIRITPVSEARSEALKKISGIVVVMHEKGTKGERPHYHIYYDHNFVASKESVTNHLKKTWLTVFEGLDGRKGDYSFKSESDWTLETYWQYVWDELKKPGRKPSLVCWNLEREQLLIPDVIVHDFGDTNMVPTFVEVKAPKKKTTKQKLEAFYQNVLKPYAEENPMADIDKDLILDLIYDYWHCESSEGCEKLQAVQMYVDYAEYRYYEDAGESRKSQAQRARDDWKERAKLHMKLR